ncbi:MAG: hypothetical protein CAK89_07160 [Opitutia bacterium AMD-G3]|nr:MAG: hypothetical protein CAK89_07160 [Opitutae bacterium AMD-G3]
MRPKLLIEGLATFFLCLACALVQGPLAPLIIGALLLALIYAGGPVSQAHYNPAVTLAFCVRRRQAWSAGAAYVGVQLLAALAAAVVAGLFHGHSEENSQHILEALQEPVLEGWLAGTAAEFLGTFLLALVILMVATSRRTIGNSYYGPFTPISTRPSPSARGCRAVSASLTPRAMPGWPSSGSFPI